jgi:hypothetical protein
MNTPNNKVTFVLSKSRLNAAGKYSIRCRITYLKKRCEFATGLFVNPNYWDSKLQKVNLKDANQKFLNAQIQQIQNKINNISLVFQLEGGSRQIIITQSLLKNKRGLILLRPLL